MEGPTGPPGLRVSLSYYHVRGLSNFISDIRSFMHVFVYFQGSVGKRGDRGEPGDPGYACERAYYCLAAYEAH